MRLVVLVVAVMMNHGQRWLLAVVALASLLLCVMPLCAQDLVQDCNAPIAFDSPAKIELLRGDSGHLLFPVRVGGQDFSAVLDTAALGIGGVLSSEASNRIGESANPGATLQVHGGHGGGTMQSRILDVEIGGMARSSGQLFVVAGSSSVPDAEVILGSRFLCQFQVQIDLGDSHVTFMPRSTPLATSAHWVEVEFQDPLGVGGISFDVLLNGQAVLAVLDTGSPFTAVNWAAARLAGVHPETPGLVEKTYPPHGLHGGEPVIANLFEFEVGLPGTELLRSIADLRINDATVFHQLFAGKAGVLLGLDFLEDRAVQIDYANKRIHFRL